MQRWRRYQWVWRLILKTPTLFLAASKGAVETEASADLTLPIRHSGAYGPEDRYSSDNQWFDWEDAKLELRQARRALIAKACDCTGELPP
jgi:hypothetical protein